MSPAAREARAPSGRRRARIAFAALAAFAAAAATGCSSGPTPILTFPENLYLTRSLTYHGVTFWLEYRHEKGRIEVAPALRQRGETTVYDFGLDHQVGYRFRTFFVGDARFPATADADLYVFLERDGPWEFRYRGQRIRVARDGRWKPALYLRTVEVREPEGGEAPASGGSSAPGEPAAPAAGTDLPPFLIGGNGSSGRAGASAGASAGGSAGGSIARHESIARVESQELRVLTHTIVFRPGAPTWLVDNLAVTPDPERVLVLASDGRVRLE